MIKAEWTNADALDLQPTCNQLATDTISRQAAIDALMKCGEYYNGNNEASRGVAQCIGVVYDLPSVQPEIIRCRDCKHYDPYDSRKAFCCLEGIDGCYPDDFCSYAERRTDE